MIQALLRNTRHNYFVLKGHSLATAEMTSEFCRLQMLLRCPAKVAWQDHEHHHQSSTTGDNAAAGCDTAGSSSVTESNSRAVSTSCGHVNFDQLLQFPDHNYAMSRECVTVTSHSYLVY